MNYIINGLTFLTAQPNVSKCDNILPGTAGTKFVEIIAVAVTVVKILQILIPIGLIVWGTLDFGKAVIEGDEKKMKEKRKPFIQRVISAVIVFLIPWLIGVILSNVGRADWKDCWNAARNDTSSKVSNLANSQRDPLNVD